MSPKPATKGQSFEQSLKRLEQIVEQLERGDISLEDSIAMYEEGIRLSRECLERLNQADLKLKTLEKDMKGNFRLNEEEDEQ